MPPPAGAFVSEFRFSAYRRIMKQMKPYSVRYMDGW
jgi:hypothetical protein